MCKFIPVDHGLIFVQLLFSFSLEEVMMKPMDKNLAAIAQDNFSGKEERYGCYQEIVVKSLMHLGNFESSVSVQSLSENLNDSGIQSLKAENDEVDECFTIHSDDGKDKTNESQLQFCSSDDNESSSECAENGWDSGSNFSEETKPHRAPKFVLVNNKDLSEGPPEVKTEADKFLSYDNLCDAETNRRDPQSACMDSLGGNAHLSFSSMEDDDKECLAAMAKESVDLEKTKGNLSLLEQAIALQAERSCVFQNNYKELDRFLLDHLAGEKRQTKVIDMGGRQIFNIKRKTFIAFIIKLP